jgi:hypothetical protein
MDAIAVAMLLDGKDAGCIPKPGVTKFGWRINGSGRTII